jgi:hypothetical protein
MYKIQTKFNLPPYVMYAFHCSLPIFMKPTTTQWHDVGISIHTFIQITHEIPKYGKTFVHVLRQRTTVFRFLRNSGYSTTSFRNSHTVFHEIQQTVVPDISQWQADVAPNKTLFLYLKKTKKN